MRRIITFLTFAGAAAVLASCGEQSGENAAADQNGVRQAGENILLDDPQNVNGPAPSTAPTGNASQSSVPTPADPPEAQPRPRTDEPPQGSRASPVDEQRRAPPPAPPRPKAEPDPHAGHDMANMTNMSRD